MRIAIISDIHYGEGENHGKTNPETGLNTRLEDIDKVVNTFVDYVTNPTNDVSVVVFAGDIYKDRKPTPTQQTLFTKIIARLLQYNESSIKIKKIIVFPGNHDIQLAAAAHSLSSLGVIAEYCGSSLRITEEPEDFLIETPYEKVLITTIPYLYRQKMQMQSNEQVIEYYKSVINNSLAKYKNATARVFVGHQTVEGVALCDYIDVNTFNEIVVPQSILERFDAAFFGHIHTFQVVKGANPLIVNQGNPITLNFGEICPKGFVVYDTQAQSHQQIVVESTKFVQIDIDTSTDEQDATNAIVQQLTARASELVNAIVKIKASVKEKDLPIRTKEFQPLLEHVQFFVGVEKTITRIERARNKDVQRGNSLEKILAGVAVSRSYDDATAKRYKELGLSLQEETL